MICLKIKIFVVFLVKLLNDNDKILTFNGLSKCERYLLYKSTGKGIGFNKVVTDDIKNVEIYKTASGTLDETDSVSSIGDSDSDNDSETSSESVTVSDLEYIKSSMNNKNRICKSQYRYYRILSNKLDYMQRELKSLLLASIVLNLMHIIMH